MKEPTFKEIKKEWHGSKRSYLLGTVFSLILTFISFFLVVIRPIPLPAIYASLLFLALLQAACQLRFFLHVGEEPKPRWETVFFWFMLLLLLAIVLGTLWIMFDLNSRTMGGM